MLTSTRYSGEPGKVMMHNGMTEEQMRDLVKECGLDWHREYRCPATARERATDGRDFVTLTPEFMQAQAEEAPDLARGA